MDLAEKYYKGHYQRWFSFEIVSIDGYIQFIIRTEKKFRDLVESAIYAQYPEAEITEVDDYTKGFPDTFPNDTHDLWGTEWTLVEDNEYPIRTYQDFEDKFRIYYTGIQLAWSRKNGLGFFPVRFLCPKI